MARQEAISPTTRDRFTTHPETPFMRHATTTTIAPTGTISIIAGCSSGIEPIFAISFVRKVLDGEELVETHPMFRKVAQERGFYSEDLMKRIAQKGSIKDFAEIPEDVRRVFVVSHDVDPSWHIRIQAAFQKYTDNAVSKTINFPFSATPEEVYQAYISAFKLGCKGLTIYRDGSRDVQVLNIQRKPQYPQVEPRPRPDMTQGITERVNTGLREALRDHKLGRIRVLRGFRPDGQGGRLCLLSDRGYAAGLYPLRSARA